MSNFVAIVKSTGTTVEKYQPFDTQEEADIHIAEYGGFTAPMPEGRPKFWIVDDVAGTVVFDQTAKDEETRQTKRRISFDCFEEKFTTQEWDDATDYVYETDTTTGKPKRRSLVQGLAKAQARNVVDLLDPVTDDLLSLLVTGKIITAARKTKILTPEKAAQ